MDARPASLPSAHTLLLIIKLKAPLSGPTYKQKKLTVLWLVPSCCLPLAMLYAIPSSHFTHAHVLKKYQSTTLQSSSPQCSAEQHCYSAAQFAGQSNTALNMSHVCLMFRTFVNVPLDAHNPASIKRSSLTNGALKKQKAKPSRLSHGRHFDQSQQKGIIQVTTEHARR